MKRRNFIRISTAGSAFLVSDILLKTGKSNVSHRLDVDKSIDPLIPIRIFNDQKEDIISQLIELRKYGFRRYLLLAPDKTVRFSGFPRPEKFNEIAENILFLKKRLANYDVEIGWECSATLKQGPGVPYQNLTGLDGRISDISFCPMDLDFREVFSNNISTVVRIARPFMVSIEDDYTLSHAGLGCFCPLHLAEFSRRQNHLYSREDLMEIFSAKSEQSIVLRRAWADLCRDTLVDLANLIRTKIDNIAPATRVLLCQPGAADIYGDFTKDVTRAFAGKTKPAVRLYGTDYGYDNAERIPEMIFHALHGSQHLPSDFELYHESDTFPHTRFFMSASKINSLITAAFAYGLDDCRYHPIQNTDNLLEDKGYAEIFKKQRKRYNILKEEVRDCKVDGCEVMYDPYEHIADAYGKGSFRRYAWANITGRLGIPHTSQGGKVKMVSGNTVELMSDSEIKKLLTGSVFLDGRAAFILSKKGFNDLIGADVRPGGKPTFLYEGLRNNASFENIKGKLMYNFLIFIVATEGGSYVELKPLEGSKIITDFIDGEEKAVTPGMITFENKLGGRVAVTAFELTNNSSSALINYKKKEIMRQTIEWLGNEPLPVYVKDLPNMFCIFNRSMSNRYAIIVITSLCSDRFESIPIIVSNEWNNSQVKILNTEGAWEKINIGRQQNEITLNTPISLMDPVIIKLEKKQN